jgi:flagella basal body P-ring formation protein FlgA
MKGVSQLIWAIAPCDAQSISRGEREKGGKGESPLLPLSLSPLLPFPLSPLRLDNTSGFGLRSSNFALFSAFLLSALLGGGPRVIAFPGAAAFDLLPTAQVDSGGIFLQQLVAANPSVLPPQPIRLADAPVFGQAASFSRAQVAEMLKAALPGLMVTNWSGASQVRITRRAHALNERELRDLLTATLQRDFVKDKGELELRFSRPWASVFVPDETLTLKVIDLPATGVSANFIARFELLSGKDRVGPWQVVAQAKVMKDVLVARTTLKPRQPLQASDFTVERRDVLSLREALDETLLQSPSLELIEGLQPGQPLLARSVRMKPVVQRGQFVDGLVRDGALNIALKVEVLADGLPGQTVRVRNPKTKREFYAKVQDEQTVVINL